jgi:hypothetical protein
MMDALTQQISDHLPRRPEPPAYMPPAGATTPQLMAELAAVPDLASLCLSFHSKLGQWECRLKLAKPVRWFIGRGTGKRLACYWALCDYRRKQQEAESLARGKSAFELERQPS